MTLQEVLAKYDEAVEFFMREMSNNTTKGGKKRSERTLGNYRDRLNYFRTFFAELHKDDEEVSMPGYLDAMKWRDSMYEAGKKNRTVVQYMKEVKIFFAFMSDDSLMECKAFDRNPISKRVIPSEAREDREKYDIILTDEQVLKLWNCEPPKGKPGFKKGSWPRNYAIVVLLLTTELRNSELANLRPSDIDWEYEEIMVRHGKGDKRRCVNFPKIAQTALKWYLASGIRPTNLTDEDYLFGNTAVPGKLGPVQNGGEWKKFTTCGLSTLVQRHVKNVTGVDNVKTHDLRHVGSRLDLHNGMTPVELQAKFGHSSFAVTQVYCGRLGTERNKASAKRVYEERDRQAVRNERMLMQQAGA